MTKIILVDTDEIDEQDIENPFEFAKDLYFVVINGKETVFSQLEI